MFKVLKKDMKTKVNEDTFYLIQKVCFKKNIGWCNSGFISKIFFKNCNFIYYRSKYNKLQYGIRELNFEADSAEEVTAEEFMKRISDA